MATLESKLADKFADALLRTDFKPHVFAYVMSGCGTTLQLAMFQVVRHMVMHWTLDRESDNDYGSPEYRAMTEKAQDIYKIIK